MTLLESLEIVGGDALYYYLSPNRRFGALSFAAASSYKIYIKTGWYTLSDKT